ncbi:MAG: hypothetical protein AB1458_12295 [Bacteroidota bacterium]
MHKSQRILLALIASIILCACDSTRLQPCCRFKPGYGGFDRYRTLKLARELPGTVAVYTTEKYAIVLDRKRTERKLSSMPGSAESGSYVRNDTLFLDKTPGAYALNRFIVREIERKNAVIINLSTGKKLSRIKRRKFNWQTSGRSGRGGREYSDPDTGYVIVRLDYWIS